MNWIKTSDRLPEKDGVYMVTIVCHDNTLARSEANFTVDGIEFEGEIYSGVIEPMKFYGDWDMPTGYGDTEPYYAQINVIAWMPYPEPYDPNND